MATIGVTAISNLNAYRVTATNGSYQQATYALYALDAHGKITSQPLTYDGVINDDRIYRDPATNRLYFKTDLQSRFLDYGYDPATGKLVMEDYTGAQLAYDRGAAMDPRLRTDNPDDMSDARKAFIANGDINAYSVTLDGVTYDQLSVSRLLLILTLARAEKIEETLVEEMNKLAESNAKLEAYSQIADQAVKSEYVDIYQATIVYKGETVTIAEFLTQEGVDVSQLHAATAAESDAIKAEWNMNRNMAFKETFDATSWAVDETSLKALLADKNYPADFASKRWVVSGAGLKTKGPANIVMTEFVFGKYLNEPLEKVIHDACNNFNIEDKLKETCTIECQEKLVNYDKTFSITVQDLLYYRLGADGLKACMDAYNSIPTFTLDNYVLSQDLLQVTKNQQDSLNNLSQETMINIQSLITARDQSYLLGSNGLKLLQNGNIMVARNI